MADDALGTLLKLGDGGGSEVFTTVAGVRNISGPGFSLNTADATNHSSTGGWAELVATVLNGGEVTFEVMWDPADSTHDNTSGLLYVMRSKLLRNFQIVWPDDGATTWTLPCYVTGFQPGAPVDGALTASVTLSVSGQPTLA